MPFIKTPLQKAEAAIANAEYILIGAGAGMTTAAGLQYGGPAFESAFADMIERYGFTDLYTSSFHEFGSEEERWAYWSRHIDYARFIPEALPLYKRVYEMVKDKPHFVITTNVDGQFYKAGFNPDKIFCVQGDYAFIQCAKACHRKLYPDKDIVKEMVQRQSDCKVPSGLVPHCPVCGGPMDINLRKDEYFIQDEHWDLQNQRYMEFLEEARDRKLVLLEYGVGFNTPTIIRLPFEKMAAAFPDTTLIRINKDHQRLYFPGVKRYISLSAWLTESQR